MATNLFAQRDYQFGDNDGEVGVLKFAHGLRRQTVLDISRIKNEPRWMLDIGLYALDGFLSKPMPKWGGDLAELNFDDIVYYVKPSENQGRTWDEVPQTIKATFERLGIPGAERKFLAGVSAQYESEVIDHRIHKDLVDKGIFTDTDSALRDYPERFREYFGTIIPAEDNTFAALNTAVWSGGSFVDIPKGVSSPMPLQAYFRIHSENMGQFEPTAIIADEESFGHYVEGCMAPIDGSDSLHSAVIEIIVEAEAKRRYTTIQNWAPNIYHVVTKRAVAYRNASMEWVDGNMGSKPTMKYPSVYVMEEGAKGMVLSIAVAGKGQHRDTGAKMVHAVPNTTSTVVSKSMSQHGGKTTYRGLVRFVKEAEGAQSKVRCDTLIMDALSTSDTVPASTVAHASAPVEHEAPVSKVGEEPLFHLISRELDEEAATRLIVMGFIEPFTPELPMEFSVEMNRLIKFEMAGSIG